MEKREKGTTSKAIEIEYTSEDVLKLRDKGVPEDELPGIGVHKFRRSKFVTMPSEAKIKITIYLDADVLSFFKQRAKEAHAAPYQTQINAELRKIMETEASDDTNQLAHAIADDETIDRLANVLAEKLRGKIAA